MILPTLPFPNDQEASFQEEKFVHNVYDEIAPHFSSTRYKPWPIVEEYINSQRDYSTGLDIGCGNGKYLNLNKKVFIVGSDRSYNLIECAQEKNPSFNLMVADCLNLPYPNETFDFAISIAVIHHLSTRERRVKAISLIFSKLKVGGSVFIYCWALEQKSSRRGYKDGDDQDVLIPWVLQKNSADRSQSPETSGPQNSKRLDVKYRYYHLYKKGSSKRIVN